VNTRDNPLEAAFLSLRHRWTQDADAAGKKGERSNFEGDRSNFEGDRSNSERDRGKNARAAAV
jgi:hypothetical protein